MYVLKYLKYFLNFLYRKVTFQSGAATPPSYHLVSLASRQDIKHARDAGDKSNLQRGYNAQQPPLTPRRVVIARPVIFALIFVAREHARGSKV